MDLLKKLCERNGLSGDEDDVRNYILHYIEGYCNGYVDKLGNIIAHKKGRTSLKKKILFDAHMDETGYLIKRIDDTGLLFIDSVGVSPSVSIGKTVYIKASGGQKKMVPGVIGAIPVHHLEKQQMRIVPKIEELYIDIGAKNAAEARKYVLEGDSVYFDGQFGVFGRYCKGKALDDRVGCFNLIRLIQSDLQKDAYFVFSVQEEVGLRGAVAAAQSVEPDLVIILECTTAADIYGVPDSDVVCRLGDGVAISFADKGTIYSPELFARILHLADKNKIKYQVKKYVSGGNNAASWQKACSGSQVITLSVPVRYLHSRIGVVDKQDIDSMYKLAYLINKEADLL